MKKIKMILLGAVAMVGMSQCVRITPTEAGFPISNSGNYRGIDSIPLETGWVWYTPGFTEVITIPTTIQHVAWVESTKEGSTDDESISISCMGGAGFKVDVGFNYHVDAHKASHIYLKWKESDLDNITATYIRNVVRGGMQDVSGHITLDSVLNNLPAFEHAADALIRQRLAIDGFIVDNFNVLSQPRPTDPALTKSINDKIKAKQDAETSIMQLQKSIADANKKVADARGDSASQVIEAQGRAEAIKAMQHELTPTYVEYIKAQKWDGALPSTVAGNGGMMLQIKQ